MTFPLKLQFLPSELCGDNTEFEKSVLASDPEGGGEKLNRLYFFLKGKIEELENFKPTRRTCRPSTDYDEAAAAIVAENEWESLPGYDATVLRTCSYSERQLPLAYFINEKSARREGRDPLAEENLTKTCLQFRLSKKESKNDPGTKVGGFLQFYQELKEFIFVDLNIGCVDCDDDSPWKHDLRVLEFDHKKSKKDGKLVSHPDQWTSAGICAYINDLLCCTIKCRNHHRMKSHAERDTGVPITTDNYKRRPDKKRKHLANIAYREAIKQGDKNCPEYGHYVKEINAALAAGELGVCTNCGLKFDTPEKTYCCDFDHVEPTKKNLKRKRGDDSDSYGFSYILASGSTKVATTHKKFMAALVKEGGAQPLCSNCHTTK